MAELDESAHLLGDEASANSNIDNERENCINPEPPAAVTTASSSSSNTSRHDSTNEEGFMSIHDIIYSISAFWETLKPVAVAMILSSLACNFIVFYDPHTEGKLIIYL